MVDRSIGKNKNARDKIIESYILHNETGKAERANILSSVTAILSTVAFLGTVGVTGYTLKTDNKTKRRQSSGIRKAVQTMSRERTKRELNRQNYKRAKGVPSADTRGDARR